MRIRKGDLVIVTVGDDSSSVPRKVLRLEDEKVVVEGVNRVYRHVKKGHPKSPQGGRLSVEMPISQSNVAVYCDECKTGRRLAVVTRADGSRARCCSKCRKEL